MKSQNVLQTPNLPAALTHLYRQQVKIVEVSQKLEAAHGITLTESVALDYIVLHPGVTPLKLSTELSMSPGAVTPLIRGLLQSDYIWIQASQEDKRYKRLYSTRLGYTTLLGLSQQWDVSY